MKQIERRSLLIRRFFASKRFNGLGDRSNFVSSNSLSRFEGENRTDRQEVMRLDAVYKS